MIYLAIFILVFGALQLIIATLNWIFRNDYHKSVPESTHRVSVVIPARNEEQNIAALLNDLRVQTYKNLEIIVVDDHSTDNTAALVRQAMLADDRIQLIESAELEKGWLGKNFACYQGAKKSTGKYLLFLDADVKLGNHLIYKMLGYLQHKKLNFVSVFPKQIMLSGGEKSVVPIMNYILLSLLPLFLISKTKFTSVSAANGQFMLFDAEVYTSMQPHKIFKHEKVEDIQIARYLKKYKFSIDCLTGNEDLGCRMYHNYNDALNGFSKNMAAFFGNSHLLGFVFWLITTFGVVLVAMYMHWSWLALFIAGMILTRIFISMGSMQNILMNLIYSVPQQLNMGYILLLSVWKKMNKTLEWKGRNITA